MHTYAHVLPAAAAPRSPHALLATLNCVSPLLGTPPAHNPPVRFGQHINSAIAAVTPCLLSPGTCCGPTSSPGGSIPLSPGTDNSMEAALQAQQLDSTSNSSTSNSNIRSISNSSGNSNSKHFP